MQIFARLLTARRLVILLVLGLAALVNRAGAQTQDDVTVAFLYNFSRFVEWPADSFASPTSPFVIGFYGRPALADRFSDAVQGKNVNGREFTVRKLDAPADAAGCQLVFVGDATQNTAVLTALKGKPVLVVGQGAEFLTSGGMIAFSRDGPRLVFDVNLSAITAAKLVPAEKLTKAARSTKGG